MSNAIIIGFDTEFVRVSDMANRILSYQYAVKTSGGMTTGIVYTKGPDIRDRMTLAELVVTAIEHAKQEGVIGRRWPTEVLATAHFTRADLASFKDFKELRTHFDNVRNSYATLTTPHTVSPYDSGRHQRRISIRLYDTIALAPNKASLEAIGNLLGLPKINLPDGAIEKMDELLETDKELFERYAIRDAEITALYLWEMLGFAEEHLSAEQVPVTLGSLAVRLLQRTWQSEEIDAHQTLGQQNVREHSYNPRTRRMNARARTPSLTAVAEHTQLATEAFHGGRNEAYMFGLTEPGFWWDVDLSGAYSTAMAAIRVPDWQNLKITTDIKDFAVDALGIARVKFRFPEDTQFPCLPVRYDGGLMFPLEGESYCASPELALAKEMGAEVAIQYGVHIPWLNDQRPFELFSRQVREQRKSLPKGSVFEQIWKEIGNSVYGKLAQGLREKNVYDNRSEESRRLTPSPITQPYLAAYITSLVRATLSEMIARVPTDKVVVSATTDGFITNQPYDKIDVSGPICTFFADQAERLNNSRSIIEVKHVVPQVLCMRTRGQLTVGLLDETMPVLQAKAGVQVNRKIQQHGSRRYETTLADKRYGYSEDDLKESKFIDRAENDYLLELFFNRKAGMTITRRSLTSMRKLAANHTDLVMEESEVGLSLEFDWKRELFDPVVRTAGQVLNGQNYKTISLSSRPFLNRDTFMSARALSSSWRRSHQLKTEADWKNWIEFRKRDDLAITSGHRGRGTLLQQAIREYLRRYTNAENGYAGGKYKYLAQELTKAGYQITETDLKNAKRAKVSSIDWSTEGDADIQAFIRIFDTVAKANRVKSPV